MSGIEFAARARCRRVALALFLATAFTPGVQAAEALATATIDHLEAVGNTLLPQGTVDHVLLAYHGALPFEQIQQAAQALQAAYRQAGYGAVVVQIPEQTLSQGVVRLEVIEGRLSQIQVAGLRAFSKENVLRGLPSLQMGQTPNMALLDSELLMVNENPAKAVRVIFQPGEKRAQVESLAIVEEQAIEQWRASLDNTGNSATGEYRLALNYQHANVWDGDNVLGLHLITSPSDFSQVAIGSASLRVPLYAQKTFLEWSALVSNTRNAPNQTPAGELRFSGQGVSLGARALRTLPSLAEYKQQVSAGVESRQYKNDCSLGAFGAAGCGSAAASVNVFPLTLGYALQKPGLFQSTVQWINNLPLGSADADFRAARAGASSRYGLWRANATGAWPLTPDWQLAWRADAQYTAQALVSAEQFGAGGSSSVRGYRERALSGDSGLNLSLEARTRAPAWLQWGGDTGVLQLAAFVDGGRVSNQLGTDCLAGQSRCSLWGSGLGLLAGLGKDTTLRADYARAGKAINETQINDWRLHFSLNHTF